MTKKDWLAWADTIDVAKMPPFEKENPHENNSRSTPRVR